LVDLAQILQGQILSITFYAFSFFLSVTFYAFSFLIVSNTYKLRAIAGWSKLHFFHKSSQWLPFMQKFKMANFPAKNLNFNN
jgi:hypothetical protein